MNKLLILLLFLLWLNIQAGRIFSDESWAIERLSKATLSIERANVLLSSKKISEQERWALLRYLEDIQEELDQDSKELAKYDNFSTLANDVHSNINKKFLDTVRAFNIPYRKEKLKEELMESESECISNVRFHVGEFPDESVKEEQESLITNEIFEDSDENSESENIIAEFQPPWPRNPIPRRINREESYIRLPVAELTINEEEAYTNENASNSDDEKD